MKTLITLLLCVFVTTGILAAETLTFKFSNPRIEYYAPDNYFTFDILVKASADGTYLYTSQVICNVTLANFNSLVPPTVEKGAFIDGMFDPSGPGLPQVKYSIISNWNSGNLNIAVIPNVAFNGQVPASGAYSQVTSSYQKLCTVYCLVSNSAGMAGISFQVAAMNAYQKYATGVAPLYAAYYNNPCNYEGYDFSDIYLNRIYCGLSGWTQAGGLVDWTLPVNTSVWDTTAAAAIVGSGSVQNTFANNLRVHPTARLKVSEGRSLTCSGNTEIKEPRGLVLAASSAGRSQFLDNGTINYLNGGSVEAQCYFAQNKWHYYSIPLVQTQARPFLHVYMKYFVENENKYKYVVEPDSLLQTRMLGYAMWSATGGPYPHPGFVAPAGLLNTGSVSVPVTRTATDGYNLIGNPYPSAIDLSHSGVSWGICDQMAWFWDPTAGNYFIYIKSGAGTRTSSYCAPQQGFFVHHTSSNSTATNFGVDNSVRTINEEPFLKNEPAIRELLELKAENSNNDYFDRSVVRFTTQASALYDETLDAFKLKGEYNAPQLYSILNDQTQLSVNALSWTNESEIVPLGFGCGESGTYSISASNIESFTSSVSLILEDRLLNISHNLRMNPVYSFEASPGEDNDRFFIHFTNPSFGIGTHEMSGMKIYSYSDVLYVKNLTGNDVKGDVFIYNVLGNLVFRDRLQNKPVSAFNLDLLKGYYLVKIVSGNSICSEKVLF